jgi:hypothetical protein
MRGARLDQGTDVAVDVAHRLAQARLAATFGLEAEGLTEQGAQDLEELGVGLGRRHGHSGVVPLRLSKSKASGQIFA